MSIILMLVVVAIALICFIKEWFSANVTAISVMVLLMALGLVAPEAGISGFSNSATITVLAMFILSARTARTGAVQVISFYLMRWSGSRTSQQSIKASIKSN